MSSQFKTTSYVTAFKIVALLSFILGVGLLSVCLWVIVSFSDHDFDSSDTSDPTSSKFRIVETLFNPNLLLPEDIRGRKDHNPSQSAVLNESTTTDEKDADETLQKFRSTWISVSPYFQGSCGVALIAGLIQLITCIAVLTSSSKGASKLLRAKLWKVVHSLISLLLICCFIIPVTVDSTQEDGGIRSHLEGVVNHFSNRSRTTNETLDTENIDNMGLLYAALLSDSIGILALTIFLHIALKKFAHDPSGKISSIYVNQ